MSKATQSIHHAKLRSAKLQAGARVRKERLGQVKTKDERQELEKVIEEDITNLICDSTGVNCTEEKRDWVKYSFDTVKGLVVGVTAIYSEECRGGLVGTVDSALSMYNHIELYLPQNFNKFGMAFNELTEATNIVFATCDMSHVFSELSKLGDWKNWEQYVALAGRIGGVFIEDFNTQLVIIQDAAYANDGYATGVAVGNIVQGMLDSML